MPTTRRSLLKTTAAAAAAASFSIVPRHVLGGEGVLPPSEKLNIAAIGVGWPARMDMDGMAPENNIVAICDVDQSREPEYYKKYPGVKRFVDYRKMLDALDKSLDAVIVATPDHTHAVLAMACLKRGKHVYCEKPLAHNISEVRALVNEARQRKLITHLGNQGHASESIRQCVEWIRDGAVGNVHTVHCGASAVNTGMDSLARVRTERPPIPKDLDWDLWLGPAEFRPYHTAYLHEKWRGWSPFGNGTIADWTCHVIDPVFWALELGAPKTIVAEAEGWDPKTQADVFPRGDTITFEFPANARHKGVTLKWHSGTTKIPRPPELEADRKGPDAGAVVYGDKGALMYGSHGAGGVRLIPETKMKAYQRPEKTIPRPGTTHHLEFTRAIKSNKPTPADWSYGGPLTEIGLLGALAIRFLGQKLEWDPAAMKITNVAEANAWLNPPYRNGWSL
jgi:predicted dehydrogenase